VSITYGSDAGGLVGRDFSTISNCYSTGSIAGSDRLGGLVGWSNSGTITNCYSTGSVSGTVGGTTLSTPTIASHGHQIKSVFPTGNPNFPSQPNFASPVTRGNQYPVPGLQTLSPSPTYLQNAGGGGSHAHPFSGNLSGATASVSVTVPAADVKYANVIVAAKD
jgi:hypothetical protein